jgi:hypothetical protein
MTIGGLPLPAHRRGTAKQAPRINLEFPGPDFASRIGVGCLNDPNVNAFTYAARLRDALIAAATESLRRWPEHPGISPLAPHGTVRERFVPSRVDRNSGPRVEPRRCERREALGSFYCKVIGFYRYRKRSICLDHLRCLPENQGARAGEG